MDLNMQGMALAVSQKQMAPNKEMMAMTMGGNLLVKTSFDGEKGYQMQGGAKKDLTADEVAQKKVRTALIEQLDYLSNPAFKLAFKGVQKVNDGDAYQVEVTGPTGKVTNEYYDVKSKLLVRTEATTTVGPNTTTQTVDMGDYRKVGAVMFPYKLVMTIAAGGQQQVLNMVVSDIKLNTGVTEDDFK
jgi:hypothetical protein